MFDSSTYGGKDLMFKDSTVRLYNVDSGSYLDYLGQDYVNTVQGTHDIIYKAKYLSRLSRLFLNTHSWKNRFLF